MSSSFLSIEYVAMALIKSKSQIFSESFVTMSKLNQFAYFMAKIIKQKLYLTNLKANSVDFI